MLTGWDKSATMVHMATTNANDGDDACREAYFEALPRVRVTASYVDNSMQFFKAGWDARVKHESLKVASKEQQA